MTEPAPPPPPPKLDKDAAREAAKQKARKFARRSAGIDTVGFNGCSRRSRHRIDCRFVGRGRTSEQLTTCWIGVIVRGEGNAAAASIRNARCHARPLLVLSPARAKAAMKAEARRVAGKTVGLVSFERISPTRYAALAEWTRYVPLNEEFELCSVELSVDLLPSRQLVVSASEPECQPG